MRVEEGEEVRGVGEKGEGVEVLRDLSFEPERKEEREERREWE